MAGATKLLTAGGGGVTLTPASSIASDVTVNVPSVNGTAVVTSSAVSAAGQIPFSTDGSTFTPTAKIVAGTSVTASGTSIDFTGIPSWVKRITVMFSGVSTNGSASLLVQTGSGSVTTSGYTAVSVSSTATNAVNQTASSSGFIIYSASASGINTGVMTLVNLTGNTWLASHSTNYGGWSNTGAGNVSLSGVLDRVRFTTSNGTDTFDAGSINILYE